MRHWQLGMAVVWMTVALGLFFRELWLPPDRLQGPNWAMACGVAAVFAAWNFARWLHGRRRVTAVRLPLQPRRAEERPYEYNPELDFTKGDRGERGA